MQIKTNRYHYTHDRRAKKKKNRVPNAGEDVEQQELSFNAGGNAKWYTL